jgi:hypothetical protein
VDPRPVDRRLSERGLSSIQFLLASGLGLILFLALANLVVVQYGRGAMRSALEQGARVGAITRSEAECQGRVEEVLGQLIGGRMGDGVSTSCVIGPTAVVVTGSATFQSWTPLTADYRIQMESRATLEEPP